MDDSNDGRSGIIKVITSPLGFFALSLLIVEGFLAIVLIFSDLESIYQFYGMIIGAVLFLLVVAGVWYLVKALPKNLTFGERGYLEEMKNTQSWGTSNSPKIRYLIRGEKRSIYSRRNKPNI